MYRLKRLAGQKRDLLSFLVSLQGEIRKQLEFDFNMTVAGDGNLTMTVPTALKTLDASKATGTLNVDVTGSTSKVSAVSLGSGDGTLTVGDSTAVTASLVGGSGADTLVVKTGATTPTVQYVQSGFETVNFANTSTLTYSAANASDITTIQASTGMPRTSPPSTLIYLFCGGSH